MKTRSLIFLTILTTALIAMTATVQAQTNTQTTIQAIQGFGSTVGGWFTSENPANRFQDAQTWAGVVDQNSAPVANEIGASYDLWRQNPTYYPYTAATNQPNSSIYLAIEGRERSSQIGIMSVGVGPQIGWMQNDIRIGLFVEPVYRLDQKHSKYRAEFGLMAEKMMSANTAVGLMISQQTHEKVPFIGAQFSVSFGNGTGFLGLF